MSGGSEWNEYWGWGEQASSLDPPPLPADPCPWDTWSVHGACPEWPPAPVTSWGWSVWDDRSVWDNPPDLHGMELIAVNDYPSKFSIYTEASDLDENDFCIDQENIFTLTIDEASTDVHVKLSLADAVVLLSNAHPRKFPDSDRVFDYLCAACGVSQEHGRPRSNMFFLTVGDVPRLLRGQV